MCENKKVKVENLMDQKNKLMAAKKKTTKKKTAKKKKR